MCRTAPLPSQLRDPRCHTFTTLGPIWADDLAIMLSDAEPERLVSKLQFVAGTLFDKFAHTGMDINVQKGKTEIVSDLRGKGAIQIRKGLYCHKPPVLPVTTTRAYRIARYICFATLPLFFWQHCCCWQHKVSLRCGCPLIWKDPSRSRVDYSPWPLDDPLKLQITKLWVCRLYILWFIDRFDSVFCFVVFCVCVVS